VFTNVTEVMVNGLDDVYVEREGPVKVVAGAESAHGRGD
jgi:hypothetical protein